MNIEADPRIEALHGAIRAEYLTKVDDEAGVDKRLIRLLAIATAELNIETGNADIASDEDYNEGDEASDYEDSE